jgi:hypothetical protein
MEETGRVGVVDDAGVCAVAQSAAIPLRPHVALSIVCDASSRGLRKKKNGPNEKEAEGKGNKLAEQGHRDLLLNVSELGEDMNPPIFSLVLL